MKNENTTHTHILRLPYRTGTLKAVKHPDRVTLELRFSAYDNFEDRQQVAQWLWPIFDAYKSDSRLVVLTNPDTGEIVTLRETGDKLFGCILSPPEPQS